MTTTTASAAPTSTQSAVDLLRRVVAGPVLEPSDAGYDEEVATWNASVSQRPPIVVGALCADDVAATVRFAIRNNLSVAVQATGHGASFPVEDGVLINTRRMTSVSVDVQPMLSVSLEKTSISFGNAFSGETPAPVSERVTIVSNSANGYALSVHRSTFSPADLPLALAATPTSALVPIPIATELAVGGSNGATPAAGDVWSTSVGFGSALPVVPPGHYTSTITFTVIGK